jgi:ubiquinone/menaquinone biosynthesis C-methylase UbiE
LETIVNPEELSQTHQTERKNLHVHYSAEDYDQYTERFVEVYDDAMIERLLKERRMREAGGVLLDVGTGTARLLIKIAAVAELKDVRLIGVDYFQDMVAEAERAVAENNLQDRIEVLQGDAHDLPYPEDFADYIISRSTIHHWANPVQAFKEIHRVLKPGGIAIIHDVRRDPAPDVLEHFNELRRQAGIEPCRLDEKYTAAEVEDFLAQAGLQTFGDIKAPHKGPGALGFEVNITK